MGLFSKLMLDFKIYLRIHSKYKKIFTESKILSLLPLEIEKIIQKGTVIETGLNCTSALRFIGRHTYIGKNVSIMSCESIGAFCSISADVKIGLMSHPQNYLGTSPVFYSKRRRWINENTYDESEGKSVRIGNDVLISASALIKNGITIADGAIIGAGSYVNEDVPAYAIVAGSPAKIIKFRFEPDIIEKLLASKWWEKSDEEIKRIGNFQNPDKFLSELNRSK